MKIGRNQRARTGQTKKKKTICMFQKNNMHVIKANYPWCSLNTNVIKNTLKCMTI